MSSQTSVVNSIAVPSSVWVVAQENSSGSVAAGSWIPIVALAALSWGVPPKKVSDQCSSTSPSG